MVHATTFTVDSTDDNDDVTTVDADPNNDGTCEDTNGKCTLRAAISEANNNADLDTITFGDDYTITLGSTLTITENLTIDGGVNTIIEANEAPNTADYRVFTITGGTVKIQDVTIRHGVAKGPSQNETRNGGGILHNGGILTLSNCTISSNRSEWRGGGIRNQAGTININNCTITKNTAGLSDTSQKWGGGIYVSGTGKITNTIIAGNNASQKIDCYGSFNTFEYNLTGSDTGCPTGGTNKTEGNIFTNVLEPFEPNGGYYPLKDEANLGDNPAINGGNNATCEDKDQLGTKRKELNSPCDIGAYEKILADPEPTNYPTGFTATTESDTEIKLTWTGSTGTQLPAKYLIVAKINDGGSYASVADETAVDDESDWNDKNNAVNQAHAAGDNTYTFTSLIPETKYDFKIYPYTNADAQIGRAHV